MPTLRLGYEVAPGQFSPEALALLGPMLLAEVGYDPDFMPGHASRPSLTGRQVLAMVDTGASSNCIDSGLAEELGLPITAERGVSGVGGIFQTRMYLAQLYIPTLDMTVLGEFAGIFLGEGERRCRALVGRTFLRDVTMSYNGGSGVVTLSND